MTDRPKCAKCGLGMTPQNARVHPEYFLHDACLPDELRPPTVMQPTTGPRQEPQTVDEAKRGKGGARMTQPKSTDYKLSVQDASELLGISVLPCEFRLLALQKYLKDRGGKALVNLFAQFVGLANSVVENNRDALELFPIVEKDSHPYQAEKVNLPTIFGALNGVKLASGVDQKPLCHGCACRLGSLANQSPSTTCDVDWCMGTDDKFMCHEHMDDNGRPTRKCAGFSQLVKKAQVPA